jgi:lipopolysaccharide export system protein LptC
MPDAKRAALALLLAALAVGTWLLARNLTVTKPTFDGHLRHDPDYIIENFVAVALDQYGRLQYTLSAPRLIHYGDDESSDIVRPYLVKHSPDAPPVHTRAERGWMPKDRDVMVMDGNVEVQRERSARGPGGVMHFDRMRVQLDK